ncbi:hypothetical protein DAY19_10835 [Halobacteriovorax vibrionivorans]|uniref:Transglutaminase-like domain-containing protein n=1 Tax=Halobacteriovorax vibrionivorans TaxID=2152716 RepID=A0ABY0IF90_9BACT|nr:MULTISPECIES: transglutaminase-like domain-containing protein [Halobacteriovorax]RZF20476.1 hypothetical protein DAY19_10835 [Halobacteriovorax vibrionivorans]TGD48831.1 hypothetical protein EP118_02220 [Halobacteriovorax sp. Y22]
MKIKSFIVSTMLLTTSAVSGRIAINVEGAYLNQDLNQYNTSDLIKTDEFASNSYWRDTVKREAVIKSIVKCLDNKCARFGSMDIQDIYSESVKKFGKKDGDIYFANVVAGLMIGSPEIKRNEILSASKLMMSFEQKIYLAHIMGHIMNNHYDFTRATSGESGIVTEQDIFNAIKSNSRAGICRDIAVVQANILKRLDVEDVYVVAYNSRRVGHATVIAQDPENPDRIVNFNYGETRINNRTGAAGLSQDNYIPEFGINYRIFDSEGNPVDRVPSEMGYILNQAAGLDIEVSSNGVQYDGINMINLDYKTGNISTRAFYATSDSGIEAMGGVFKYENYSKHIDTVLGVGMQTSRKEIQEREFHKESTSAFMGMDVKLKTGKVDIGPVRNLYADIQGNISIDVGHGSATLKDYQTEDMYSDNLNSIKSSLYADTSFLGANWKSIVSVHASIMKADVRDEGKYTVAILGGKIENVIKKQVFEQYGVGIHNIVYIKQNGATTDLKVSVYSQDGKYAFEVGIKKPIAGKVGFWVKGSEPSAYATAKTKILDENFELSVQYIKKKNTESTYNFKGEYKF